MIIACSIVFLFLCGKNWDCKQCEGKNCIPRIIWSHWSENKLPVDVEEMVRISRDSLSNFTYLLLTPDNISSFTGPEESFPSGYKTVHYTGKSDYISVCVLEKYGGLYIDSTTYINSGAEIESLFRQALHAKRSVFGFAKQRVPMKFLIEINFYGAYERSLFMKKFKEEYDAALKGNVHKYINETNKRLKKKGIELTPECRADYFLMNNVFLRVNVDNASMADDVYMFPTNTTQYLLANECKWKTRCIQERLFYDPIARAYPLIKVSAKQRRSDGWSFHIGDNSSNWEKITRSYYKKKELYLERIRNASKVVNNL